MTRNEFLATKKTFANFELRMKCKLVGTEGFVNGGIQFRSKRIANPPNEMSGYQADIGEGYWGCLYDESRRNRNLMTADKEVAATFTHETNNTRESGTHGIGHRPRLRG